MRKSIIKMASVLLVVSLVLSSTPISAKSNDYKSNKDKSITFISKKTPATADTYARIIIVNLLKDVVKNPAFYGVTDDISLNNYTLGEAYTIFNVHHDGVIDDTEQYNYPVIVNDKIVLILSVMKNQNNQWSASIAKNEADYLNELAVKSYDDVILYSYDGVLYAETEDNQNVIAKISSNNIITNKYLDSFVGIPYLEKRAILADSNNDIYEVDPYTNLIVDDSNRAKVENIYGYTPGFIIDTSYGKLLDYSNYAVTQNGMNLCWSACAATAINYRAGYKKYTAESLATNLGKDYMNGGSIYDTQSGLNKYGSQTYTTSTSTLPFSTIVSNIGTSKKAIVSGCLTSLSMGHMVLIVGYSTLNNTVQFYNPGTGSGGSSTTYLVIPSNSLVTFDFSYVGYTFTWKESVY
jgi:hypothetical protein